MSLPGCRARRARQFRRGCGVSWPFLSRLHDALHENAGCYDDFGIERTERDDFPDLRDRAVSCTRHDRPEVACGLAVDEIAPPVASFGPDECIVAVDRHFQHVVAAVNPAGL